MQKGVVLCCRQILSTFLCRMYVVIGRCYDVCNLYRKTLHCVYALVFDGKHFNCCVYEMETFRFETISFEF